MNPCSLSGHTLKVASQPRRLDACISREQACAALTARRLPHMQGSAPRKNAEYIFAERGVSGEDVMDRAKKLAMIATDLKKLALMDLSWHPWF